MAETTTLVRIKSDEAFLEPGEKFSIEFIPISGETTVWANRAQPGVVFLLKDPVGGPHPTFEQLVIDPDFGGGGLGEVDLPPIDILGGIRIEVFQPGAGRPFATLDTETFSINADGTRQQDKAKNILSFHVSEELARKKWRCQFTNITQDASVCLAHIQFPEKTVPLIETRIPRRLLNRSLRQFFIALALQVYAHKEIGLVKVRREIQHLTDGRIGRARFRFDEPAFTSIQDVELTDLKVTAGRDEQLNHPKIVVEATFTSEINTGKLELLGVDIINGLEIRKINIALEFILVASPPLAGTIGTVIVPFVTAKVSITGGQGLVLLPARVDQACNVRVAIFPPQQFTLTDVEKLIECLLKQFFVDQDVRRATIQYLTDGFIELAQRGHVFFDIGVDDTDYIVTHFRVPRPFEFPEHFNDDLFADVVAVGAGLDGGTGSVTDATTDGTADGVITGGASNGPERALDNLNKIDHIVVLMMENRSFDHMLGYLTFRGGRTDINGLTGDETNLNPKTGQQVKVRNLGKLLFQFSPHHDHKNVLKQINNGKMDNFLANFVSRFETVDPDFGMGLYTEEKLPVYDFLAQNYVVCDHWFCSHPGPTMPNRLCTLTGKTPILDNLSPDDPKVGYLTEPTIFDFLTSAGIPWAYYEQDIAFLRLFNRYRLNDKNVLPLNREEDRAEEEFTENELFFSRLANGNLPAVTFIDPNFIDVPPDQTANDDHPPADVANGQELVRHIYNALVRSPLWEKTLFVITYDEHGGFFDHVPPPGTKTSPEGESIVPKVHEHGPAFLGVRVPTFVISPWVNASGNSTLYDHTAIMKTILLRFNNRVIPAVFGERVLQANHLGALLTRDMPRLDVPTIESIVFSESAFIKQSEIAPALSDYHDLVKMFAVPKAQ